VEIPVRSYLDPSFVSHGTTARSGRGLAITLRHTTLGRTPLDD